MGDLIKAIGLLSGGLDSSLAVRVVQDQGIEVIGLSCRHPFHSAPPPGEEPYPVRVARELGIELVRPDVTERIIELVKRPPHGHGKFLNPCIDCRILYLGEGEKLMKERGARFLFTGEVIGQRPMSQRRDAMNIIDRDSGLRGLVLRPLCAGLMTPTIPEEKGWVDRERLLRISGRGRGKQYELAEEYGLKEFSSPAGGCLLTMEGFANKMRDLLECEDDISGADVDLLKAGRHFRMAESVRLVVGRDDADNRRIDELAKDGDLVITSAGQPGPLGLIRGEADDRLVETACRLIGRYMNRATGPITFNLRRAGADGVDTIEVVPMQRHEVERYRI